MSAELSEIKVMLMRLESKVDALTAKPKANLKRVEFAKLADMSPRTVSRKIDAGLIRTEKGRVPFTELRKFVS